MKRILIIGASGTGTTTVGRSLADILQIPHIETDDLFWLPTEQPFTSFRNEKELQSIVQANLIQPQNWILSGSPCGWGDEVIDILDLAIFLVVPTEIRLQRIETRETIRFGEKIMQGGIQHKQYQDFIAWTRCYDTGGITGRTKALHDNWIKKLSCPILTF